jgi:hypothetical protein
LGHRHFGRQMVDAVNAVQQGPQLGGIAHVATGEEHAFVEGAGIAGAEVIENTHVVAEGDKTVGQVMTDETGASGDQIVHGVVSKVGRRLGGTVPDMRSATRLVDYSTDLLSLCLL